MHNFPQRNTFVSGSCCQEQKFLGCSCQQCLIVHFTLRFWSPKEEAAQSQEEGGRSCSSRLSSRMFSVRSGRASQTTVLVLGICRPSPKVNRQLPPTFYPFRRGCSPSPRTFSQLGVINSICRESFDFMWKKPNSN